MKKILVINVGSTSTKVAYYEDKNCVCKTNLEHPVEELSQFNSIFEQKDYRTGKVTEFCKANGVVIEELDAIGIFLTVFSHFQTPPYSSTVIPILLAVPATMLIADFKVNAFMSGILS